MNVEKETLRARIARRILAVQKAEHLVAFRTKALEAAIRENTDDQARTVVSAEMSLRRARWDLEQEQKRLNNAWVEYDHSVQRES